MDWAIIQVDASREGTNDVRSSISATMFIKLTSFFYYFQRLGDSKMVLYEFKPGSDDKDLTDQDLQIYGRTSGYSRGWYSGLRDALVGETVGDELTRLPTVEHSIVDVWETVLTEWGFGGLGAYNGWSTGGDALCWLRGEPDQLFHSCGWSV